uniref:Uncharacterized protein n=1 Tax=Salix viminalis TaxID=40686 RepID=A0A6N2NAN1_SALVM
MGLHGTLQLEKYLGWNYKDYSLGQTQFALAEAPNEALPLNCRPNFGVAWLTKDRFKVNKTYDCWYTSGISKVSLYRDDLFSCLAKDPSQVEMIKRYFILCCTPPPQPGRKEKVAIGGGKQ